MASHKYLVEGWQQKFESNYQSHDHLTKSRDTPRSLPSVPSLHPVKETRTAAYLTDRDVLTDSQHHHQPIFSHDILHQILPFCPPSTLLKLLQLSKPTYLQCLPHLYKFITLNLTHPECLPPILLAPLPASDQDKEWKPDPRIYIKNLSIPAHSDSYPHPHPTHSLDLPNLDTLHLTIHRKSPIGWSYCKPDAQRYPYYPISRSCSHLFNLQPRRLIVSGMRYINTPSPFPLVCSNHGKRFWEKIEEVVLVLDVDRREESRAKYEDGLLDNLPTGLQMFIVVLGLRDVNLDEILEQVELLDHTSTDDNLPEDQQDLYGLDLVIHIDNVRIINFRSVND
ncbi:hypothetical protein I302_100453 [Kwoniella bestiolae CBS 10118]|uniref:F-box domain-containing protein n=1 Tax=Kwoniella bestiolae CBS 10118 TaxID=1296100 RepID=A0A1B9G538_9TREE|nr:hypothetical protein I302_03827 [Kwoniella bestiolae CBS 10118]OCF26149.1 hypothetical protein I302_03827 [Kwoniella bestiolae CBS 10118]